MSKLKHHLNLDTKNIKSCIAINSSVSDAIGVMKKNGHSYVIIEDNGHYAGIFTDSDLKTRVVAVNLSPDLTPISSVMTADIVYFDIETPIDDCLDKLEAHNFRHLPIIKKGKLEAVLTARQLLRIALNHLAQEREHLMDYITA